MSEISESTANSEQVSIIHNPNHSPNTPELDDGPQRYVMSCQYDFISDKHIAKNKMLSKSFHGVGIFKHTLPHS